MAAYCYSFVRVGMAHCSSMGHAFGGRAFSAPQIPQTCSPPQPQHVQQAVGGTAEVGRGTNGAGAQLGNLHEHFYVCWGPNGVFVRVHRHVTCVT